MLVKKILFSVFGASMLFFLIMGPQLGKVSKKAAASTSDDTTAQTAYTSGSGGNIKVPTTGSTSTYNSPSIKLPDGSELKLPSYTPTASTSGSSTSNGTTTTGPDASVCASAQAAVGQIQSAYAAQNQPLQDQSNNYKYQLMNNNGQDMSSVMLAYQAVNDQITANMQKMNQQLAPYQQQVIANCN